MVMAEASGEMPEGSRKDAVWLAVDVEDRLIEAFEFQHRVVRIGQRRLRASDGPWRLVIRDTDAAKQDADNLADYQPEVDTEAEARGRGGLRSFEVDRMEQALGWSDLLAAGETRLLVGEVIEQLARPGHAGRVVSWPDVRRALIHVCDAPSFATTDALRMRYRRALLAIAKHLNANGVPLSL